MLTKRQLAVSGYVRCSVQISKIIQNKIQTLCYNYYGKDTKQSMIKDEPKIKVHYCNSDKQFSCFIGTQLNGLYDNLIRSAKEKFEIDDTLKIYEQYKDGNKSYIGGLGDLIDHLDDNEKQKYLHLHLQPIPPKVSNINIPFVIKQSCTDISKSPDIGKSPDVVSHAISVHYNSPITNTNNKMNNSFRQISTSSIHSFHSILTDGDFSDSSTEFEDIQSLLKYGCEQDESILLNYGYKITETIRETFNGCIYKAEMVNVNVNYRQKNNNIFLTSDIAKQHMNGNKCNKIVAIKKIDKKHNENNIIKEAKILNYLTVKNKSLNNNICMFIDFIETKDCYYLIEEFGGLMNLKQFTEMAHKYIKQKRLKIKQWKIVIKYIFWQLVIDMFWMHNYMYCFHLDLNMENIFVHNAIFVESKYNNEISIDATALTIKMCGFGLSEVFNYKNENEEFKCNKLWLPKEYNFSSPQILDKITFNAMKSDIYSLGVILYTICCGILPYESPNVSDEGYSAIKNNNLSQYLYSNGLSKYISKNAFEVIEKMLNFDESQRINMEQILHHRWFRSYYSRCKSRINRKRETQKLKHFLQENEMKMFPYYNCQK